MLQAGVEAVNTAGGAAGLKFEISTEDTQTQPQAAVLAVKKAHPRSTRSRRCSASGRPAKSLATLPLASDADLLFMNTSGAPRCPCLQRTPKDFRTAFRPTNDRFGRAFAEIAEKEGFKRPATMAFNNASGIGNTEGFRKAWEKKGGKVVEAVVYEPNQSSYRSELQKVLAAKPDVIVTGSYIADTTIILREWYQTGDAQKWIIPGWAANSDLIKAIGPQVAEGIISVESVSNEGSDAFKAYDAAYQKAMKTRRAWATPMRQWLGTWSSFLRSPSRRRARPTPRPSTPGSARLPILRGWQLPPLLKAKQP